MRAFAEAAVDAVQGALDWDVDVLLVDLAIGSSILGVAHASTIVAPTSVSAVIGASLKTAVHSSITGLAPASAIEAQTVV